MFVLRPKTAFPVIGLFVCSVLVDGAFRFGFFSVTAPVCNPGIGLGVELSGAIMWSALGLVLGLVLSQSLKRPFKEENLAWGAVFIGGATNAIDRYVHGCVMDYLHVPFFPSFNLADIMIFLGVVILGLSFLGISLKAKPYVS